MSHISFQHRADSVTANPAVWVGDELVEATSSRRYKDNVRTLEDSHIDALRPVRYVAKGDPTEREQIGLIAEEVALVYPEFVTYAVVEGDSVPNGLVYDRMVAVLILELQKQKAEIAALKAKLNM